MLAEGSIMKIVHITYVLSHGGVGTLLGQIANRQVVDNDVEIIVLSDIVAKEKIEVLDSKVKITLLNRHTGSISLKPIFQLNKLLATSNADIYHFHEGEIIKYLLPFVWWRIKKKSCVTMHCMYSALSKVKQSRLAKFNYRFAISQSVKDVLFAISGLKSQLIYNGIEFDNIKKKKREKKDFLQIVQIGRLVHEIKGQDILIRALGILKREGISNWHVTFLGGVGNSKEFLEKLVKENGVKDNVSFIPPKDHSFVENHLCDYDLLVQPSRSEGFGLTIAEAMAAKVPVVVSNLPALLEIIDEGKYGLFFDINCEQNLADKIRQVIYGMYDNSMVDLAYARAKTLFSIDHTVDSYMFNYKEMVAK